MGNGVIEQHDNGYRVAMDHEVKAEWAIGVIAAVEIL